METCIIVTGNPADGHEYVGPFPNATEATEYAERFIGGDYWVVDIDRPAMETRGSIERKTASGEWDAGGLREALVKFARRLSPECANYLSARVDATDGRFYLPSTRA